MEEAQQTPSSETLLHEAEALLGERQIESALVRFDWAQRAGADADRCAAGRWQGLMLTGDFAAAWQQSDAIRLRGAADPHRFWQGEALTGKRAIVRCLHGLGDAVQMLRYLPLLRKRCASLIVEVPPVLLPLAPCFDGADHVMTWGEHAPAEQPPWDVQIEVMELPYLFRTAVADLPIASHYLRLPDGVTQAMAHSMGVAGVPRVGVVWSASEWDPTRCLPFACLARLLAEPGIEFWNLQGGAAHARAKHETASSKMHDAATLGDGLLALAAVIATMDLVITVDTLAAHLAGALGKDAWVLLQHGADWRWMHQRNDSPWYPTLRLFRQPVQEDWHHLTTCVCEELALWARGRN